MDKDKKQYIVLEQTWLRMVDTFVQIVGYGALAALNHIYWGGSWFLDLIFFIGILSVIAASQSSKVNRFSGKTQLKEWLDKE